MSAIMAKRKSNESEGDPLSRKKVKYLVVPVELWEALKKYADQDERPVNWAARKAIREFLEREGQK